jgi:ABC-2 type transport system permease protein
MSNAAPSRRSWFVIARREFLERVKTKWFIIATLLGPVMMLALILVPALLARTGGDKNRITIVDRTTGSDTEKHIAEKLQAEFAKASWTAEVVPGSTSDQELLDQIGRETINSFIIVPPDPLGKGQYLYQGDNAASQEVLITLAIAIDSVVKVERGAALGLSQDQIKQFNAPPNIEKRLTTGQAEGSSGTAAFIVGYAIMFILYMAIVLYGVNVMRSVVEEKTSRVVELMVAAAKPRDLMAGKILGVGAVGLLQLTVWLGMAVLTLAYRDQLLGIFGASSHGSVLPALAFSQIAVVLIYFLLGYFFYAALFAAVGAMVSSDQEAQQAQTPVTMLLLIPATCVSLVANNPRGTTSQIMTMIPFSSPTLMPMRYLLGGASLLQLLLSIAILMVSVALVVALSAKIYRVGILMYGKRPSMREVLRWLRY